jgi:CubicO group peptidase (beta-lactamase class C family)
VYHHPAGKAPPHHLRRKRAKRGTVNRVQHTPPDNHKENRNMSSKLNTIDSTLPAMMDSWDCPGLAVAVVQGDEIIHMAGYGLADKEAERPVTPDTGFALASVTKAFTAMGVALLVDEGVLEWDKPVRDYLSDFRLKDEYIGAHLTVRDTLCHRSGLPRHDLAWYNADFTREELVHNLRHLDFSAGLREKWQYQNIMYVTAGYLCGKLTGQSWEAFIQSRIFDALGMSNTWFYSGDMEASGDYALAYKIFHEQGDLLKKVPYYDNTVMGPAGAIHSTVSDMARWLQVHLNGGRLGDLQLVSPGNLAQMHRPQMVEPVDGLTEALMGTTIQTYGMGWRIKPYRGHTLVEHGGNIDGFNTLCSMIPEANTGVIVLSNLEARPIAAIATHLIYEQLLDLPDHQWNQRYHAIYEQVYAGQDAGKATAQAEKVADAPPTHPLADYAGEYAGPGYPDFKVRLEGETLEGWLAGRWNTLAHQHYDVFHLVSEKFEVPFTARFFIDAQGAIEEVSLNLEPNVDDILFTRKPPTFDKALLQALSGVYDFPLEGLELTIRLKGNTVFAVMTGSGEMELVPYRQSGQQLEFNVKEQPARLAFEQDEKGNVGVAIFKQMGQVFRAPRVEG